MLACPSHAIDPVAASMTKNHGGTRADKWMQAIWSVVWMSERSGTVPE